MPAITTTQLGAPPFLFAGPPPVPPLPRQGFRVRLLYVVLAMILCVPLLCIVGVASYFQLSSTTQVLQHRVVEAVPGPWDKKFAINVGRPTLALAQFVSGFFQQLPPEARAALDSLRGAEVGVYKLKSPSPNEEYSTALAVADKAMKRRGWERIIGVTQRRQLVAVYAPRSPGAYPRLSCCLVVLNDQDLVVASAHGDVEPLLDLARQHLPELKLPGLAFAPSHRL
jgi:hypothetical protein